MNILTSYVIDADRKIVSVGGAWEQFSADNGGHNLSLEEIKDKSIFDFVVGDSARLWLDSLIRMALESNEPVQRPYRCDSPDTRRYMLMTIVPEESGLLTVQHALVAEEKRLPRVSITRRDQSTNEGSQLQCSVCGKIKSGEHWVEADEATQASELHLTVVNAICNQCGDDVQA